MRAQTVLQIPEVCVWNEYVQLAEASLRNLGHRAIHPGLCRDNFLGEVRIAALTPAPDIIHLHWPETLADAAGHQPTLRLLHQLRDSGSIIIQTIHNLRPHDPESVHALFTSELDAMTHGVHFFTPEHEHIARRVRAHLPRLTLHLQHPGFPLPAQSVIAPSAPRGLPTIGCFGRLRGYKRIPEFVGTLLEIVESPLNVVVAGKVDDPRIGHKLSELAAFDSRLDFRPGHMTSRALISAMSQVDVVVLPYEQLWASGVLILALQLGKKILCPRPVGAAWYSVPDQQWTFIEPWMHERAAAEIAGMSAAGSPAPPTWQALEWSQAGSLFSRFYREVTRTSRAAR